MNDARVELTLAISFLTRLRLPSVKYTDAAMARSVRWYPLVGLAMGAALAVLFWGLTTLFPQAIAVLLTLAAGMLVTGALHEDGLADLADGLGGSPDKDRALDIMRDSRIGTYGLLALVVTLAIKATALTLLPIPVAMAALVAAHGLGRLAMVWLMERLPYVPSKGDDSLMNDGTESDKTVPRICLATTLVFLAVTSGLLTAIVTALTLFLLVALFTIRLRIRLQGYSGDALGACEQLTETLVPLVLLACL